MSNSSSHKLFPTPFRSELTDNTSTTWQAVKKTISLIIIMTRDNFWSRQTLYLSIYMPLCLINSILQLLYYRLAARLENRVSELSITFFIEATLSLLVFNTTKALIKTMANYCSMRLLILWRIRLMQILHELYLDPETQLYYVLNHIDSRLDNCDQRLTNDVDTALQFLVEYFLGGIFKSETGFIPQLQLFIMIIFSMYFDVDLEGVGRYSAAERMGFILLSSSLVFVVSGWPSLHFANRAAEALKKLQQSESDYRVAHTRTKLVAESIASYSGEASEGLQLDRLYRPVHDKMKNHAKKKAICDIVVISSYQLSHVVPSFVASIMTWNTKPETRIARYHYFENCLSGSCKALLEITKQFTDLTSSLAFSSRVIDFVDTAEEYLRLELERAKRRGKKTFYSRVRLVPKFLRNSILTPKETAIIDFVESEDIVFEKASIYLPTGTRLLLKEVSFRIKKSESLLILGPSGIGKTSILRVLAGLWPFYKINGDESVFSHPGRENLLFLAQTPYLNEGSLFENIVYPVSDVRKLTETTEKDIEDWFFRCGLEQLWQRRGCDLHSSDEDLSSVLSLGEQQRLQFVRLLCHVSFLTRHGNRDLGFFAILDESTSAMDVCSERMCYTALKKTGIGFLSVGHRPTIIQYHDGVLEFLRSPETNEIYSETRSGSETAKKLAAEISILSPRRFEENKTEDEHRESEFCLAQPSPGFFVSPYMDNKQDEDRYSLLGRVARLLPICFPSGLCSREGFLLFSTSLLVISGGILEGFYPSLSMWFEDTLIANADFFSLVHCFIFSTLFLVGVACVRTLAGYSCYSLLVQIRSKLNSLLCSLYFWKKARLYYTLNFLDTRVDNLDQRLTYDLSFSLLYSLEILFGGLMRMDSGIVYSVSVFCSAIFFSSHRLKNSVRFSDDEKNVLASLFGPEFFVSLVILVFLLTAPNLFSVNRLASVQQRQTEYEARFRIAHTRIRSLAESIAFFNSEEAEHSNLKNKFRPVFRNFELYANKKFIVDMVQMTIYYGVFIISDIVAWGFCLYFVYPRTGKDLSVEEKIQLRNIWSLLKKSYQRSLNALMQITKQTVDCGKCKAFLSRTCFAIETMEDFIFFGYTQAQQHVFSSLSTINEDLYEVEQHTSLLRCVTKELHPSDLPSNQVCSPLRREITKLVCHPVLHHERTAFVQMKNCTIATPNGRRVLLRNVSLKVNPTEAFLIVGPSGVGKSSILRVLGQLWPCFRTRRSKISHPRKSNMLLVAQKPYIITGSLRQQIAYPVRDKRLITELTDERLKEIFEIVGLKQFYKEKKREIDKLNIDWSTILSLGEQQRIQFGRVFWHHEYYVRHGDTSQGFFAILDESTSSMDPENEKLCYTTLRRRGIGFISVAHRPTVIQFHDRVLELYFDDQGEIQNRVGSTRDLTNKIKEQIYSVEDESPQFT